MDKDLSHPASDKALQELAAKELARSGSPRRASKRAGVSVQTIQSWKKDPEFLARIAELSSVPLHRTIDLLVRSGPSAVKALHRELTRNPELPTSQRDVLAPGGVRVTKGNLSSKRGSTARRVRAARVILDFIHKFAAIHQLNERLQQLDQRTAEFRPQE